MRRRPGECVVIDVGPIVEYVLFSQDAADAAGAPEFHAIRTALDYRAMRDVLDRHPGRVTTTPGAIVEVHRHLRGVRGLDAWGAACGEFRDRSLAERWFSLKELSDEDPVVLRDFGPVDASLLRLTAVCLAEYESAYLLTSDGPLTRACQGRRIPTRRVSDLVCL